MIHIHNNPKHIPQTSLPRPTQENYQETGHKRTSGQPRPKRKPSATISKATVENDGRNMEAEIKNDSYDKTSPAFDFEDPVVLEPIPPQFQFEEDYSGFEDAVLNKTGPNIVESNVTNDPNCTADKRTILNDQASESTRISSPLDFSDANSANSDSISSVFSDSSATSSTRSTRRKYERNTINAG